MNDQLFFAALFALLAFLVCAIIVGNATWIGAWIGLGLLFLFLLFVVAAS